MIQLLYGEDTYSLSLEIKKQKSKFSFVEELAIGDLTDAQLKSRLVEILQSQGLFAAAKLVILKNFLTNIADYEQSAEYLLEFCGKPVSGTEVIFFQEEKADKRLKFFKALSKLANARELTIPVGNELQSWIENYLSDKGFKMENAAVTEFVSLLGQDEDERLFDLWQVAAELEKLMLLKSSPYSHESHYTHSNQGVEGPLRSREGEAREKEEERVIKVSDVKSVVKPNASQNIFRITNMFAEGNVAGAVRALEEIDEAPQLIIGGLASQLRSLLLVKALEGESSAKIAARLGWKEGRVWINNKLAQRFSKEKLVKLLADLKALDLRLKTSEEPPKLLLALFIQKAKV